ALAQPAVASTSRLTTAATIHDRDSGRRITEPPSFFGDPDGPARPLARMPRAQCAEARCPGRAAARPAPRATARSRRRYETAAPPEAPRPGAGRGPPPPSPGRAREKGPRQPRGRAAPEHTVPLDPPAASRSRDRSGAAPFRQDKRPLARRGTVRDSAR